MRKLLISLVGASALAFATGANAASCGTNCTYTSTAGNATYSGPAPTFDWDSLTTTPVTTGGSVTTGTDWTFAAQPLGSTGNYYAVGPAPGTFDGSSYSGSIDLSTFLAIQSISFIWGSADTYNTLDILARDGTTVLGTISGGAFNGGIGSTTDPLSNPIVTLAFDPSIQGNIGSLRLTSSYNAFEVDNFVIGAVPEPATWALMLLGFGGIGVAMRRRRKPALAQLV
jgi:PEP-CTERM motif